MANTNDFVLKVGDTYPPITAQLMQFDNTVNDYVPVGLALSSVRFRMSIAGGSDTILDQPATIVDASQGIVQYAWALDGSETSVKGDYIAEWRVTFSGGRKATFPRGQTVDFNTVKIEDPVT
jgi:hypothetical protein